MDIFDLTKPMRYGKMVARSENPEIDLILAAALYQSRLANKEKKRSIPSSLKIEKNKSGTVIKTAGFLDKAVISAKNWGKINLKEGWKDLARQGVKISKNPMRETASGVRSFMFGSPGEKKGLFTKYVQPVLGATYLASDAYKLTGKGERAKKQNMEALSKNYGPDVANYYQKLKKKQYLADNGRFPQRLGSVLGDVGGIALAHNVRGIVPSTAALFVPSMIGRKIGKTISNLSGKRSPTITDEERAALSTLSNESKRLLKTKGVTKTSSVPWNETLLAAALGIINGYNSYHDLKHPGGEDDERSRLMKRLDPVARTLYGARISGTSDLPWQYGAAQLGGYLGGGYSAAVYNILKHGPFIPEKPLSKHLLDKFMLANKINNEDESGPQPVPTDPGPTQP